MSARTTPTCTPCTCSSGESPQLPGHYAGQAANAGRPKSDVNHLSEKEHATRDKRRQQSAEATVRKRQKKEEKRQEGVERRQREKVACMQTEFDEWHAAQPDS